ncbi:aspartate kinase [Brassicibacter mesophilus]|uniref:aspartate kinase n=1 Tax=Brassicibacter mesophilus TaxID=745119 RepID=UPI003D1A47E7
MAIIVQKYGGSSVETIDKMKDIAKKVIDRKIEGNDMVIVISAMGKTTNNLIAMTKDISESPCKRELDMLLSTGEQVSISLLSMVFKEFGYDAISLTGLQAGIRTQGNHTKSRIEDIDIDIIKAHLNKDKIVIVAGFQGVNKDGDITTLGRGGSDTTAVALAAKLNCLCEIYTDVEGIYSVDPRLYKGAKKLQSISYEEMMEMSSLGAKVMETRSVEIGHKFNVPIYVALSNGKIQGTYIKELDENMEQRTVTGLTASDNVLMVTINNVPYNTQNISLIFEKLADEDINVDMISQTSPYDGYVNVSFTTAKDDENSINIIIAELKKEMSSIEVTKDSNISKISVIGTGMRHHSGVAAKVFNIFANNSIEFKQVTTSEISISYTISNLNKQKAINVLARELNL